MPTYTVPIEITKQVVTELARKGKFPLLETAEDYKPNLKDEPITRIDLVTDNIDSAQADETSGFIELKAYSSYSIVPWVLWRGIFPNTSVPSAGTSIETFWRQNGLDYVLDRIMNQEEALGIATLAAAYSAGTIRGEATHIVGGGATTLDAMTASQRLAYLNHVYQTLSALRIPNMPDKLLIPSGKSYLFQELFNGVTLTESGGTVTIATTTLIFPWVRQICEGGLLEDDVQTATGYMGARVIASPLANSACFISTQAGNQTMQSRVWNEQLGQKDVPLTHTTRNVFEKNSALALARTQGCYWLATAWT